MRDFQTMAYKFTGRVRGIGEAVLLLAQRGVKGGMSLASWRRIADRLRKIQLFPK